MARTRGALLLIAACGTAPPAAPTAIANDVGPPAALVAPEDSPMWIEQDGVIHPLAPGRSTLTLAAAPFQVGWWALLDDEHGYGGLRAAGATSASPSAQLIDDKPLEGTMFEDSHGLAQDGWPHAPALPIDLAGFAYVYWDAPDDRRVERLWVGDDRARLAWPISVTWQATAAVERPIAALAGTTVHLALFVDQDWNDRFDHGEWSVVEIAFT